MTQRSPPFRWVSRLLRGGVGPDLNHIVYVVGEGENDAVSNGEAAFRTSAAEMTSFLAFAEAFAAAGTSSSRPLPEAVVVTHGVHACVDGDMVRAGKRSMVGREVVQPRIAATAALNP